MRLSSRTLFLIRALLGGALAGFIVLATGVFRHEGFAFDAPILAWLYAHRSPALDQTARLLTLSASAKVLAPLSLALLLWLWYRKGRWTFFLLGVGGASVLNLLMKEVFARGRPHLFPALMPEKDHSFPSGHALGSMALALALGFALLDTHPSVGRLVLALGAFWSLMVGLSRLYLQVHYPSDVLAGFLVAMVWVFGLYLWMCKN